MRPVKEIERGISVVKKYRYKWVFFIAVAWTLVDVIGWYTFMHQPAEEREDTIYTYFTQGALLLRSAIVFAASWGMGYLLVFRLKRLFRDYPLFISFILKTLILIVAAFIMYFLISMTYSLFTLHVNFVQAWKNFVGETIHRTWIFDKVTDWFMLFLLTQLLIEINEKYSPGVFIDILTGKYINPKIEKRIVMFLDLKDSTPIAEQLGHKTYFRFIRDFIYSVSMALLESGGNIYQYVGDEIVVSWKYNKKNALRCIQAVIAARRSIQKRSEAYRRAYGIVPEFRVGMHVGEVTVGEIGIVKKDIAMSGDTMNTAARIRTATSELNQKFLASREFVEHLGLKEWQAESMGNIELKGKSDGVELFALKI